MHTIRFSPPGDPMSPPDPSHSVHPIPRPLLHYLLLSLAHDRPSRRGASVARDSDQSEPLSLCQGKEVLKEEAEESYDWEDYLKVKDPLLNFSGGSRTITVLSMKMVMLVYDVLASSPSIKIKVEDISLYLTRSGV